MSLNLTGATDQKEYEVEITITNNISNSSIVGGNTITVSGIYQSEFTKTVRLSLSTNYGIELSQISALFTDGSYADRELQRVFNSDGTVNYNQVDIVISGNITNISNVTDTLTLEGEPFSLTDTTEFSS